MKVIPLGVAFICHICQDPTDGCRICHKIEGDSAVTGYTDVRDGLRHQQFAIGIGRKEDRCRSAGICQTLVLPKGIS